MQIVIDIPEEVYKKQLSKSWTGNYTIHDAIVNGTPLPKEHGNLIDIGKCDRKLFYQQCGGANSLITVETAFDMLLSLPPIIEANKTESEVGNDIHRCKGI